MSCLDNLTTKGHLLPMLNPQSHEPVYRQLASELERMICDGRFADGECIPSEPALAAQYKIGRPTVRQATDLLVRRGMLERRRGSGTFVKQPEPHVSLFDWGGTTAAFERSGLVIKSTVLRQPTLESIAEPEHPLHGREVFVFVRLAQLGTQPVLLESMALDAAVFPRLDQHSLEGQSISELVKRVYKRSPNSIRQSFRVGGVPRQFRSEMRVTPGTRVLVVNRLVSFPGAPAAVFATMYCQTEQLEFTQTLPMPSE